MTDPTPNPLTVDTPDASVELTPALKSPLKKQSSRIPDNDEDAPECEVPADPSQPLGGERKSFQNDWTVPKKKLQKLTSYESIDQNVVSSKILHSHASVNQGIDDQGLPTMAFSRWLVFLCVGLLAGAVNVLVHDVAAVIWENKFDWCQALLDEGRIVEAWLGFCLVGTALAFVSSVVIFLEPSAAGSSYPENLAYLNGVEVPLSVRSFVVKFTSCILVNAANFPVGLEGPVIGLGAIVGEATSYAASKCLPFFFKGFAGYRFRQPDYRRGFILAGISAGASVALGAPVGGLIFVWEELSHSTPELPLMVVGTCVSAVVVSSLLHTIVASGDWESLLQLTKTKVLKFPQLGFVDVNLELLPAVVVVALVVGVVGGMWTATNLKLNKARERYHEYRVAKVLEVVLASLTFLSLCFGLLFVTPCESDPGNLGGLTVRGPCAPDEVSPLGSLLFAPVTDAIQVLFTDVSGTALPWDIVLIALAVYGSFSCFVSGSFSCGGLIVPTFMCGGLIGHLIGVLGVMAGIDAMNPAMMSLIGAGSFLSAVTRKGLSIVIIMVEISGEMRNLLPVLLGVVVSRVTSERITPSLFRAVINLKCIPVLPTFVSVPLAHTMQAQDIMSDSVVTVQLYVRIKDLLHILNSNTHNAFPVVMHRKTREDQMQERRAPVQGSMHRAFSHFAQAGVNSAQLTYYHPEHEAALKKKQQLADTFLEPNEDEDVPRVQSHVPKDVFGGTILRSQLYLLLQHPECFLVRNPVPTPGREEEWEEARRYLPSEAAVELPFETWVAEYRGKVVPHVKEEHLEKFLDLSPYYNASALSVKANFSLPLLYNSFRSLCLRHVVVLNDHDFPIGMVTRLDLLDCMIVERAHSRLGHTPTLKKGHRSYFHRATKSLTGMGKPKTRSPVVAPASTSNTVAA